MYKEKNNCCDDFEIKIPWGKATATCVTWEMRDECAPFHNESVAYIPDFCLSDCAGI